VVDEILSAFAAATETTQSAIITVISYFIKNPDGLAKVRKEFDSLYQEKLKEDPTLAQMSRMERLNRLVNAET
jgi:cytochrome P450